MDTDIEQVVSTYMAQGFSDAYICSVMWAKYSNRWSIQKMAAEIAKQRMESCNATG